LLLITKNSGKLTLAISLGSSVPRIRNCAPTEGRY